MRVDWALDPEQRAQVEPHLAPALAYLPPWVQSVYVRFDPDLTDLAAASVAPEYRYANFRVGSGWFSEPEAERRVALIHEVLHAQVETLSVVLDDLLKATGWKDDDPLCVWAKEQWRRAEEGVICDLSRALAGDGPRLREIQPAHEGGSITTAQAREAFRRAEKR